MNELPYCSCVGPRRRGNQPRTKVCTGEMENSSTSKQLLHTCLTHLSLGTYVHTFFFFSTTVISSITSIAIHTIHSLRHRPRLRNCKPNPIPYLTLPTQNFKLSIHPVRELVAGCSDSRYKTHKRHSGGGGCKQRGRITLLPTMGNFSKKKLVLLNG